MSATAPSKKTNASRKSTSKATSKPRKRRSIGRPANADSAVGRDALISKTCELLSTMPPNEVTRAEVARAMNVDPSLIRYYFKDRSTLLLAAFERLTSQFLHMVEDASDQSDMSAPAKLRARASALLRLETTYPFFQRLILEEVATMQNPAARKLMQDLTERGLSAYGEIINEGVKDGSLRAVDPLCVWIAVIGMCQFFIASAPIQALARKKTGDKAFAEQYRDFICELLVNGLRAQTKTEQPNK